MALQPGVNLGLHYNMPPSLSIPCSVSPPFVFILLSQVHGHFIQPSHFRSSSSSWYIQLSVHLFFWRGEDCGVLHSFYMTKPSYFLGFNKPDSVLPLWLWLLIHRFVKFSIIRFSFTGPYIFRKIFLSNAADSLSSSMVSVHDSELQVTTGRINVRHICNLLFFDMRLLLNNCIYRGVPGGMCRTSGGCSLC